MSTVSNSFSCVTWHPADVRPSLTASLPTDAAFLLALRFFAHLPYFKAASTLVLPQGLGNVGVMVTTLVFALTCLVASRWIAGLRRLAAVFPHRAALPLLGATAVLVVMMLTLPLMAQLLPRHAAAAADLATLLPACLLVLAPVTGGFFLAQWLTASGPCCA